MTDFFQVEFFEEEFEQIEPSFDATIFDRRRFRSLDTKKNQERSLKVPESARQATCGKIVFSEYLHGLIIKWDHSYSFSNAKATIAQHILDSNDAQVELFNKFVKHMQKSMVMNIGEIFDHVKLEYVPIVKGLNTVDNRFYLGLKDTGPRANVFVREIMLLLLAPINVKFTMKPKMNDRYFAQFFLTRTGNPVPAIIPADDTKNEMVKNETSLFENFSKTKTSSLDGKIISFYDHHVAGEIDECQLQKIEKASVAGSMISTRIARKNVQPEKSGFEKVVEDNEDNLSDFVGSSITPKGKKNAPINLDDFDSPLQQANRYKENFPKDDTESVSSSMESYDTSDDDLESFGMAEKQHKSKLLSSSAASEINLYRKFENVLTIPNKDSSSSIVTLNSSIIRKFGDLNIKTIDYGQPLLTYINNPSLESESNILELFESFKLVIPDVEKHITDILTEYNSEKDYKEIQNNLLVKVNNGCVDSILRLFILTIYFRPQ